jgi:hypothetical protein
MTQLSSNAQSLYASVSTRYLNERRPHVLASEAALAFVEDVPARPPWHRRLFLSCAIEAYPCLMFTKQGALRHTWARGGQKHIGVRPPKGVIRVRKHLRAGGRIEDILAMAWHRLVVETQAREWVGGTWLARCSQELGREER